MAGADVSTSSQSSSLPSAADELWGEALFRVVRPLEPAAAVLDGDVGVWAAWSEVTEPDLLMPAR